MLSINDVLVGSSLSEAWHSLTPIDKKIPDHARLILIRHSESNDNLTDTLSGGERNPELTAKGLAQAHTLAVALDKLRIDVDLVVSSPLARAQHTADIIQNCAWSETPQLQISELREMAYGDLEGASMRDCKIRSKLALILRHWHSGVTSHRVGGQAGESLDCMASRVVPALRKLLVNRPGKVVVCVTHSHVIKTILSLLLSDVGLAKMHTIPQHNCGVNILDYDCRDDVQSHTFSKQCRLYGIDLCTNKRVDPTMTHNTHRMKCITEADYVAESTDDIPVQTPCK